MTNQQKELFKKIFKRLILLSVVLSVVFTVALSAYLIPIIKGLPNLDRIAVELEANQKIIPDHAKKAVIAIDDRNFYQHPHVSLWTIAKIIFRNATSGGQGYKMDTVTVTMQSARQILWSNSANQDGRPTIKRRLEETFLTHQLETRFNKEEILQLYLNQTPFGLDVHGVASASQKYFDKNVQDITLEEAAVLAALIQSPTKYSPYGPNKNLLLERKNYVLDLMTEQGYITEEEAEKAKSKEIIFAEQK